MPNRNAQRPLRVTRCATGPGTSGPAPNPHVSPRTRPRDATAFAESRGRARLPPSHGHMLRSRSARRQNFTARMDRFARKLRAASSEGLRMGIRREGAAARRAPARSGRDTSGRMRRKPRVPRPLRPRRRAGGPRRTRSPDESLPCRSDRQAAHAWAKLDHSGALRALRCTPLAGGVRSAQ